VKKQQQGSGVLVAFNSNDFKSSKGFRANYATVTDSTPSEPSVFSIEQLIALPNGFVASPFGFAQWISCIFAIFHYIALHSIDALVNSLAGLVQCHKTYLAQTHFGVLKLVPNTACGVVIVPE
jgi:hypothetical protein